MGGYSTVHNSIVQGLYSMFPDRPKWLGGVTVVTALAATALDVAADKYAAKTPPESDLHDRLIAMYNEHADRLFGGGQNVTVNVINQASSSSSARSRYMMEEGHTDINTDCFSCASAHLAATKAALERARDAAKDGTCGADCRKWLNLAADESAALLSWDWTDERVSRLPEHQRQVIEPRKQQVEGLFREILGNDHQAVEVNKAKSLLGESIRFVNSGDGVDHPEVAGRLKRSEEMLAAAERLDITAFDADTANKLRRVRQAVGSKIESPDAVKETYRQAREVAQVVNDRVFSHIDTTRLDDLTKQADEAWSGFKQDRIRHGDLQ